MRRFHARKAVIDELKKLGLYVDTKENAMSIPLCSCVSIMPCCCFLLSRDRRSGDVIEPLLKPQWYVACRPLADETVRVSLSLQNRERYSRSRSERSRASCASPPLSPRRIGTAGWRRFMTGVFLVNSGGGTGVRRTLSASKASTPMYVYPLLPLTCV